ncbi:DNA-binding transcriptional regulator, XRE-family HTH domain [Ekhidna lutea]|uniref:DNA-binding transcriptional regulator, XRE-family HTH domain n=1 Tax=Ekhidna lutea TaxID=447679 RepID=A0A239LHY6_EKHLU|nr:helix-turn-helix transcriptional regulator [Ekhidna lutea]SNT30267.1 DNA-binding transcriptional regulator, XRE-family HTH domain [Ekhidna lutea]
MFSNNFKYLRKSRGKSQVAIAKILDVNKNTIQNYETGKSEPDVSVLIRIAKYFNVDYNSLLETDLASGTEEDTSELLDRAEIIRRIRLIENQLTELKEKISGFKH